MKKLILAGLFTFVSLGAQAGILNIDLKQGTNYVNINWEYEITGCSPMHTEYSVIQSLELEAYVVGANISTDEPMKSSTPLIKNPPNFPQQCFAQVPVTARARFKVLAYKDQSIEVVVPQNFLAAPKVEIEHTPALPLHFK